MKKLIVMSLLLVIILTGCSESTKVETPPWSKEQVKQMEEDNVKSVPLVKIKF